MLNGTISNYEHLSYIVFSKCVSFRLLAIGIEQFDKEKPNNALSLIQEYMMPPKTVDQLRIRLKNVKASTISDINPLKVNYIFFTFKYIL